MASSEDGRAELSCIQCKKLKRRCSKDLPACLLCSRVRRRCEYPKPSSTPTRPNLSSGFESPGVQSRVRTPISLSSRSDALSAPNPQISSSLAGCFVDSVASRGKDAAIPVDLLWQDICPGAVPFTHVEARHVVEEYYKSTHTWLPIISKLRVDRIIDEDDLASADIQILLHAMELDHSSQHHARPKPRISQQKLVKYTLFDLEQAAQFSTNFLAASVLLALHEVGHGLFPAAYFTVANVARICLALGIHDRTKATQILPRPFTWTETEERRRLWWAVLILDRYVHVGLRFRPLCTPRLEPSEILPARDGAWDNGDLTVNPLLVMSIEASTSVDPFARTCQAAHLLGWVCEHVNQNPSSEDADLHFQEAFTISNALRALITMLSAESDQKPRTQRHQLFAARGLAYAALNTLYDVHSCIEPDNIETIGGNRGLRLDLQKSAIEGFKQVIGEISELASEIEEYYEREERRLVPIMALFCLYSAAGTYGWYFRENTDPKYSVGFENLRRVLSRSKWRVAGIYIELLDGQDSCYTCVH